MQRPAAVDEEAAAVDEAAAAVGGPAVAASPEVAVAVPLVAAVAAVFRGRVEDRGEVTSPDHLALREALIVPV
jgi:hypothetical protein